jgi:hypothetical protein
LQRDNIVVEIQSRLNLIKIANGYDFDIRYIFRNPEGEPSPDLMPLTNIFEFSSSTVDETMRRGAKEKPVYKKFFRVVLEHWYNSASKGECSRDITTFLKAARLAIFADGQTLGGLASIIVEEEVSRVYRPMHNVVGIGEVLSIQFTEDFNNL